MELIIKKELLMRINPINKPIQDQKRKKRLIYNPAIDRFFFDRKGDFSCRQQANHEKMIIPYFYEDAIRYLNYQDFDYPVRGEKNLDIIEVAIKLFDQLNFFSLVPGYDFSDFMWSYPDDFATPYNGPRIFFEVHSTLTQIISQIMHFFQIETIRIGNTLPVENTHGIFKYNTINHSIFTRIDDDYSDSNVHDERYQLVDYSLSSLFSVMQDFLIATPGIQLNYQEINKILENYQFSPTLKSDFFYLLEKEKFKKIPGMNYQGGLTYQDITSLALRIHDLAGESLLNRSYHLPDSLFIEGQFTKPRIKSVYNRVMSALKKAEKFDYPLLAKNKKLKLLVDDPFSKNLINELVIVSLSNKKIQCSFESQDFLNHSSNEELTTITPDSWQGESRTEPVAAMITTVDSLSVENSTTFNAEKAEKFINPPTNADYATFLSELTLTSDCQLTGQVSNPIEITLPIFIHDTTMYLVRYITFVIENPTRENIIKRSANLDDEDNAEKLIRNKRLAYIPWKLIFRSFDCRQQSKFEKMRIPYQLVSIYDDQSTKLVETIHLVESNLNKLNLFELVDIEYPAPVDFFYRYLGPKLFIGTQDYITYVGGKFSASNPYCSTVKYLSGLETTAIGCHIDTNANVLTALIHEIMNFFGLLDIRIGETVTVQNTQGIYVPKVKMFTPDYHTVSKSQFAGFPQFSSSLYELFPNIFDYNPKRTSHLLEKYSLSSIFSFMHEPLWASDNYELNMTKITTLLEQYQFSQDLKADFDRIIEYKKLTTQPSPLFSYQDLQALAKLIYYFAPHSLVGRVFNFPDVFFIEDGSLVEANKLAFNRVLSALKKAEKFEYALLAQNKTLILKTSAQPFVKDLIQELAIVSLSDSKLSCTLGNVNSFDDPFFVENSLPVDFSQTTATLATMDEMTTSIPNDPIQDEFSVTHKLTIRDCKLIGTIEKAMQLTLPIIINDTQHTLTRYLTLNLHDPSPVNYLIVNRPTVTLITNYAHIDLKWLCAVTSVAEETIRCQVNDLPTNWLQQDCLVIRNDVQSNKMTVNFFNSVKNNTCEVTLSPNLTLPLIFPTAEALIRQDTMNATNDSTVDQVSTIASKISYYQKMEQQIDSVEQKVTQNTQEKTLTKAWWGSAIAALSSLGICLGYGWIRRFRRPSATPALSTVVMGMDVLEKTVGTVNAEIHTNIRKKENLTLLHNEDQSRLTTTPPPFPVRTNSSKRINNNSFSLTRSGGKRTFFSIQSTQLDAPQDSKINSNVIPHITNSNASYIIRFGLYCCGYKPTVERMNRAERLESSSFDHDKLELQLDFMEKQLHTSLLHYNWVR